MTRSSYLLSFRLMISKIVKAVQMMTADWIRNSSMRKNDKSSSLPEKHAQIYLWRRGRCREQQQDITEILFGVSDL